MRIPALLLSFALGSFLAGPVQAQNPGAQQDAEAAREKLLKASDELDNIQTNSENTRVAVDGVKTDVASLQQTVTKLQDDNTALKQQLADLQAAFDQYKQDQVKARQALIDNVADMLARSGAKSIKKKAADTGATPPAPEKTTEVHSDLTPTAPGLTPPPETAAADSGDSAPAPKPPKGYYHVVADGETVSAIAEAYRDSGVKVTASQIRKANGLTPDSVLKPGEKLFIPKPGT